MRKHAFLLSLCLVMVLLANLRPCYRVTVAGQTLPGRFSFRQTEDCAAAARETAEEILSDSAAELSLHRSFRLSFRSPDGDTAALTDALICSVRGVRVSDAVWVNGTRLGTVEDGEALCEALRSSILGQMPHAAVSGNISGKLELRRVYTRSGSDTPIDDMVLLICGMAPVIYVDEQGRLA
ncbi:MAG: hypothetical protein IK095_06075 [Oscillospiraceae bacterium]|nr:hypothetical protein [Oscillospiraceae bacterium]